jgi:hypothetical protein
MTICPICETNFKFRSNKIFCSRNCKEKAHKRPYLLYCTKENFCSNCKFIAEHSCQLDVDHIDGDKNNNDKSNIQTLCANCHRLKTHQSGDFVPKSYRPK